MSHNDDATFRSYITPTIGIDTRNVVRNLPEDRELVDSTRGVAFTRDTGAPKPHISSLYKTITPLPPDLVAAVTTKFPHSTPKFIASKARKLDFERRKEEYHASKAEQVASAAGDDASSAELPTSSIQSTPSPFFNRMLKYNHLQATAIDRLWSEEPTSILQCVEPLMRIADPAQFRPYYPHSIQRPTAAMRCPYCAEDISTGKKSLAALHLLKCHCKKSDEDFCFACAKCFKKGGDCIEESSHSSISSVICGIVCWRGLVIRLGECPFVRLCGRMLDTSRLTSNVTLKSYPKDRLPVPIRIVVAPALLRTSCGFISTIPTTSACV